MSSVFSTEEGIEFLEHTYAALLTALRRSDPDAYFTAPASGAYLLVLPASGAIVSWSGAPLPDLLSDVDTFRVTRSDGTSRTVEQQYPVMMLAYSILDAAAA